MQTIENEQSPFVYQTFDPTPVSRSDSPTSIRLLHEEGKEEVIPRVEIKSLYATKLSAMPADLEKQVDLQQMADLLKFLKTAK